MQKRKIAIGAILVILLLATFVLVQPAVAKPHTTESRDISVQQAYAMIKHQSRRNPVLILDVRNQSEYNLGHLYDAVLMPLYELEDRLSDLSAYLNDKVVVYCKAGSRSAPACQILSEHGFTKVYNMQGGIDAWMQADYPIDTSYHHVSVDVATNGKKSAIDIQPFLLYQTSCTSCGQATCSGSTVLSDVTITVLEETENHTMMLLTYEVNGSTVELNIDKTLLWTYTAATNKSNKTITFVSIEITTEDTTLRFYNLKDVVQHEDYILTIDTTLVLDSGGYSSSLTNMSYTPTNKGITSFELIEFNSSSTLSQQYKILGKVAKDMAQVYQKSENKTLKQLSNSYYTVSTEAKYLSNIVQTQLPEYNQAIRYSVAFLSDDYWSCLWCTIGCMASYSVVCAACCLFTAVCCVCVEWVLILGLDTACGLVCLMLQQCQ